MVGMWKYETTGCTVVVKELSEYLEDPQKFDLKTEGEMSQKLGVKFSSHVVRLMVLLKIVIPKDEGLGPEWEGVTRR